jgi:hypothetical protein
MPWVALQSVHQPVNRLGWALEELHKYLPAEGEETGDVISPVITL